ncbi:hypothetical protein ACIPY0_12240 [Paenarthrobacter nicotinovorans]|uniref:hypothetical protein n=1 Tax=Paenarthrobacter nicotinovorans TaxID=29320 RepID=UPI0037FF4787
MSASFVFAIISVLFWGALAFISGQPALLLVAVATGLIFGAPFIVWVRHKH